ncbi:MAG: AAA family ATPase [Clostridia bacterium]|nr:AAA family ATPase [Clostridia bacterium]
MAKLNIVLADSDELFLNHLTNYLLEKINTFEVYSFTTKESLVRFIEDKSNKIDIIAFSEDLMDGAITLAGAPVKVLLSDGSYSEVNDFKSINKYQKAEKFVSGLLLLYAEATGRVEAVTHGDKNTKIVGFYSPVGGSGKTVLSVAAACALARRGKRVFYLNAEKINSTASVLNRAESGNMSDIYLNAKTKGANIGLRIMANKYVDMNTNISYINPAESSLEINELTSAEFKKILKEFETLGEFDVIIVDFDSEFNKDKIDVLSAVDKIFVPFTGDSVSVSKIDLFMKELEMYDELSDLYPKINLVLNKAANRNNPPISANVDIKASIGLSTVFGDIGSILNSGESIVSVMSMITGNI